jgi:lipopolysaccharide biosynthesis regulator YciM
MSQIEQLLREVEQSARAAEWRHEVELHRRVIGLQRDVTRPELAGHVAELARLLRARDAAVQALDTSAPRPRQQWPGEYPMR